MDRAQLMEFLQPVIDRFVNMGNAALDGLPKFILGLVLFSVFVIIGKIFRFVIRNIFRRLKVDDVAVKLGLSDMLSKIGLKAPLSSVISSLVYYVILLLAVKTVAEIWGIEDISAFVDNLIAFLPKLLVAVFIMFAGLLVAELAKNAIHHALDRVGVDYAGPISSAVYGLLSVVIGTVVLGLLGIETELLNSTVLVLLSAFALAVALSLGLGLRSVAKNIVSGVYARDLFPPGSILEIEDTMAVVREVGAVATRLESDNGLYLVIPNSTLVEQVNKGKTPMQNYAENG